MDGHPAFAVAAFLINKGFFARNYYREFDRKVTGNSSRETETSPSCSDSARSEMIALIMKLVLRHKRTRTCSIAV